MTKRDARWSLGRAVRAAVGAARSFMIQEPEPAALGPFPGPVPLQAVSEIIGMLPHDVARTTFALVCREWNEVVRSKHICLAFGRDAGFASFLLENNERSDLSVHLTRAPQILEPHMPLVSGEGRADGRWTLRVRASPEQLRAFVKGGLPVFAPAGTRLDESLHEHHPHMVGATVVLSLRLQLPEQHKFIVMQLLELNGDAHLWTRAGRVGNEGICKLETAAMDDMEAKLEAIFERKTGVTLADAREGRAMPKEGKYTWFTRGDTADAPTRAAGSTPAPGSDLPLAQVQVHTEGLGYGSEEAEIRSITVCSIEADGGALLQINVVELFKYLFFEPDFEVSSDIHDVEWERRMKKTDPEGVCFADGDVPSDLVEALQSGVDKLAARPDKDYHPGSDDVVLDHVHPALYPFIKGTSEFVPSDDLKNEDASGDPRGSVDGAEKLINKPNSGRWGREYENSIYQWLPTYFDISANGKVSIRGDINNLRPRDEHQGLYESLGLLFEQFVPDLEAVLSYADLITFPGGYFDYDRFFRNQDNRYDNRHVEVKHRLSGQALQVIPKIVDYELKPGQSYEGVWHVEGMSHENIIATCLYILDRDDSIEGGHLLFKRAFTAEDGMILGGTGQDRDGVTQRFIDDGMVPLGQVQTPRGRRVVFPNSHVHRVAKMTNTGSALARRRIIAFFVVDPLVRIVSTQECPDQRSKLSLEAAKEHRLELMRERRLHKQDWNVRDLNLCEH